MATYKGFAETSIGGAPVRRFLLDLDLSVIVPGFPEVVTYLDLDGGTPSPDLAVRIFFNSDLGPNLDADPRARRRGLGPSEIAPVLGMTTNCAKVVLHRARRRLSALADSA